METTVNREQLAAKDLEGGTATGPLRKLRGKRLVDAQGLGFKV